MLSEKNSLNIRSDKEVGIIEGNKRRNEIVKILYGRGHETISNLAFEFGVSIRTIQRDIDAISLTVPVYTQTGRHGGGVYVLNNSKKYIQMTEKGKIMKKEEKLLFKCLCNFKSETFDEKLLEYATPAVLGQLFFNRMQSIAYGILKENNLLGKINREFRNSIKVAYEGNVVKNHSFFKCIQYVADILSGCSCKYAMLKGAFLCGYYPEGYRTSNDIDLLILPENVTEIGNVLTKAGFLQGYIRSDKFIPATRKEIIESKMMRGETVPYIKEVNMPGMKYLEVDINFSLDYKNGDTDILKELLDRARFIATKGSRFKTLDYSDFFIHLCSHLYKEATTLPWVEMKRDMTLYKYCDIYVLLSDMGNAEIEQMFNRAEELNMEKLCAFAILQTADIFDIKNKYAVSVATEVLHNEPEFIHKVFSPKNKKSFIYEEKDIYERLFAENRRALLKEVKE